MAATTALASVGERVRSRASSDWSIPIGSATDESRRDAGRGPCALKKAVRLWPEVAVMACWLTAFFLTDFVFRDDESFGHRIGHAVLWLSLAFYVAAAVREHRLRDS
jgi:hypothetical protein